LQQLVAELVQQVLLQQQRRAHNRANKPGFLQRQHGVQLHGVQQLAVAQLGWQQLVCGQAGAGVGQAGAGATVTGTRRHRVTHTSTGTQVLTRLQTVQGTHSFTV
jgi:hypothetical protein